MHDAEDDFDGLDPEQIGNIDEALRACAPRAVALLSEGITQKLYEHYKQRAAAGDSTYVAWLESMAIAEAAGEVAHLKVMGHSKEWRARLAVLERRFPDKYGAKLEIKQADQAVKEVLLVVAEEAKKHDVTWLFDKVLDSLAEADSGERRERTEGLSEKQKAAMH